MAVLAYKGVSEREINTVRTTSEGLSYNLNHPDELIVDMKFTGKDNFKSNSQGWERDSKGFFQQLKNNHPEYFSKKNSVAIENGTSPKVDAQFVKSFPQYKGYEGQTLVHHHIGGDGQAVAVPQGMHRGFGEIHNVEKNLGITRNCRDFSKQCEEACNLDNTNIGKSADYFRENLRNTEEPETKSEQSYPAKSTDRMNSLSFSQKMGMWIKGVGLTVALKNYSDAHDHGFSTQLGYNVALAMKYGVKLAYSIVAHFAHANGPQDSSLGESAFALGRVFDNMYAMRHPEKVINIGPSHVPQEQIDKHTLVVSDPNDLYGSVVSNPKEGDAAFFEEIDRSDEISMEEDREFFAEYDSAPESDNGEDRSFFEEIDRQSTESEQTTGEQLTDTMKQSDKPWQKR